MRCEFCVNVSRFSAPLVGSYGESCVAEKTKSQRDKGTKGRRVKKTKGQRDEEIKRKRVKETKGQRDEERKRQRDEKTKTASPPIHLLFVSSSLPLHSPIRSILIQFVSKNIREIRVSKQHTKEHRFVRGR